MLGRAPANDMKLSREEFERLVAESIEELPEKFHKHINNVAIFVEDFPTDQQLVELGEKSRYGLLGLFEGYGQAKRLNYGPVLPDRITIFRVPILQSCRDEQECRERIKSTVKHEIAHHFGSDEKGARRAGRG